MLVFGSSGQITKKQFFLLKGQSLSFLDFRTVRHFDFSKHIGRRVAANHIVIDGYLKYLVDDIMDDIYRRRLQDLIVDELVIESAHIRFFHLYQLLLSESWLHKQLIHINVVFHGSVLDASFQLAPKLIYIIHRDIFDIGFDAVMLINKNLFLLLPEIFQCCSVYGITFSELVCPAVHIAAGFSLYLSGA